MPKTMGEIIKRLRKERGITQEALAELLCVTPQAVSKWENNTGMPDISQIVPLANTFGVSTDVLFGMAENDDKEEIKKMIADALSELSFPRTQENYIRCYKKICDGLKTHPNDPQLLIHALELGISLAFPENDCYCPQSADRIYAECIRYTNLLTSVGKNQTDIMRAHMIMVLLHAAHGNKEEAVRHARHFPWRSDMTVHAMEAIIAHFDKRYRDEQFFRMRDLSFHTEAVLNDLVQYARAFRAEQKYDEALKVYEKALTLIEWLFEEDEIVPSLHQREWGDIHVHMATLYMNKNDHDRAVECLTKMTDYDIHMCDRFRDKPPEQTSLLFQSETFPVYYRKNARKEKLLGKLQIPAFAPLTQNERYLALLKRAKSLED